MPLDTTMYAWWTCPACGWKELICLGDMNDMTVADVTEWRCPKCGKKDEFGEDLD